MVRDIRTLFVSLFAIATCLVLVPNEAKAAKRQPMDFTIYFPNGSSAIDLNYKDNAEVVSAVKRELRNPRFVQQVDSVVVIASASPDGKEVKNITLAWNRAAEIKSFVKRHMQGNVNVSTFSTIFSWKNLGNYIYNQDNIRDKEAILDIIYDVDSPEECEAELRKLNDGYTWRYLSREILPYFRSGWTKIILYKNGARVNRNANGGNSDYQEYSDDQYRENGSDDTYFNTPKSYRGGSGNYDFDNSDDHAGGYNDQEQSRSNRGWNRQVDDFYSNDDNESFEVSPRTSLTGGLNSLGGSSVAPEQRRSTTRESYRRGAKKSNNNRRESRSRERFNFDNSRDKLNSSDSWGDSSNDVQFKSSQSEEIEEVADVQNFQTSERATNFYADSKSALMMTPLEQSVENQQQEQEQFSNVESVEDESDVIAKVELQVVKRQNPSIVAREKRIAERDRKDKLKAEKRRVELEKERSELIQQLSANPNSKEILERKIKKVETQLEEDRIKLLIKEQKDKARSAIDMERSIASSREEQLLIQQKIAEAKEKQAQQSVKNKKRAAKRQENRSKKWVDEKTRNLWGEEVEPAQSSKSKDRSKKSKDEVEKDSNEGFFKTTMPEYR